MRRLFIRCFRQLQNIYIDPAVYLLIPFALLSISLDVLLSWLTAACFHEMGHILTMWLLGGRIKNIRVGLGGAVIHGEDLGKCKNFLSILAGPFVGILPVLMIRRFPLAALFALTLTAYNLLPFWPLDGGRMLRIVCDSLECSNIVIKLTEYAAMICLIAAAVYFRTPIPVFPLILPFREKYLANRRKRGYNSATI